MSLHAIVTAHANGFDENMYLDSATRTKVEETGGANFIFVTKDNKIVTPHSDTILPSITRRSIMYVAEHYLGLEVEERDVYFDEVKDFAECGLCGTAAVISPVGKVVDHGNEICFPSGMEKMGPPNCTVVGVPGRIVKMDNKKVPRSDMDQIHLPDPVLSDIKRLQEENLRLHKELKRLVKEIRCVEKKGDYDEDL